MPSWLNHLLLLRLPGTRIYILSETGYYPTAPACWARNSNGHPRACPGQASGENLVSTGKLSVCLLLGKRWGGRSRGKEQRAGFVLPRTPEGSAAWAGSHPHPDVMGGERDGAESPCPAADTNWMGVTCAGTPQVCPKQRFGQRTQSSISSLLGGEGASVLGKGTIEGSGDYRRPGTSVASFHPPVPTFSGSSHRCPHSCLSVQRSGDAEERHLRLPGSGPSLATLCACAPGRVASPFWGTFVSSSVKWGQERSRELQALSARTLLHPAFSILHARRSAAPPPAPS